MDIREALSEVVEGRHLTMEEMRAVMQQVMTGGATDAQIGALLVALRMKGESIDEIAGAAAAMRELATPVAVAGERYLIDIVGTGGDNANLFNVSTASAFVAAAAGCHVAKHGNRSVSSSSGAADLLEAAGIRIDLSPKEVAECIHHAGVGFMFAPAHHSAMKHAIGPRRELGLRTLFNILGPLTNPAGVKRMLLGVYDSRLLRPLAEVLGRLGAEHVLVVHGHGGLDEISLSGETAVAEFCDGEIQEYRISPENLGIARQSLAGLEVADAAASYALVRDALGKRETQAGARAADLIALNAGAAIFVAGVTSRLRDGVVMAEDLIHNGEALETLRKLASFTVALRATEN